MSETPAPSPILRYFAFGHLPEGPLRRTSMHFADVATLLDQTLPSGAEKSTALRKLLEAKDAAVRAALDLCRYCGLDDAHPCAECRAELHAMAAGR